MTWWHANLSSDGTAYSDAVMADRPVIYWRMGEESGRFTDSSGRGNHAGSEGSGLLRARPDLVPVNLDRALTFTDGDSRVVRSAPAGLSSTALSVELWFRTPTWANWIDWVKQQTWDYTVTATRWQLFSDVNGHIYWDLITTGGTEYTVQVLSLTPGRTYHAVGTYDGSVSRLYLQGELAGSTSAASLTLETGAPIFTGNTETTAHVTVDELAVYPSALSATRVAEHYRAAFARSLAPPHPAQRHVLLRM